MQSTDYSSFKKFQEPPDFRDELSQKEKNTLFYKKLKQSKKKHLHIAFVTLVWFSIAVMIVLFIVWFSYQISPIVRQKIDEKGLHNIEKVLTLLVGAMVAKFIDTKTIETLMNNEIE